MLRSSYTLIALAALFLCLAAAPVRGDDAAALAELIDRHIQARLDAEGLTRAPEADDAEFLRRLLLDLHGRVPSADVTERFLDSRDADKRQQLISEVQGSSRYGEHFANVWRGRLISMANDQGAQSDRFADWLAQRLNDNEGWDRIALDLVTATGKMEENAAVTWLIEGRHPLSVTDLADLSSRYFLGIRLNCAQCHDHPQVAWKRQDYWGLAAFFTQIQTPGRPKMVYVAGVRDDLKMTLATLSGGDAIEGLQVVPPTFLSGGQLPASDKPNRVALAEWMTSPDNPYFARAAVNRMWWQLLGRGIVSPVDDMHEGNVPSHPELLDELARKFVESGFDLKLLARGIVLSRTYQETSRPGNQADAEARLFARMPIKVLTPEQLYDSLVVVLGQPAKTPAIDTRPGARREFCQFFAGDGDPDPTRYERGIPHVLRLMNSPQFAGRNVAALASRVSADRSADAAIEQLYLTVLSRRPTQAELDMVRDELRGGAPAENVCRELVWALIMSSEFSLNH